MERRDNSGIDRPDTDWDPIDPFVYDPDGFVVGLKCAPPHHAEMLAAGWEGGRNLFPLVADRPGHFTADVLVYTRDTSTGPRTQTAVLSDEPPYTYLLADVHDGSPRTQTPR